MVTTVFAALKALPSTSARPLEPVSSCSNHISDGIASSLHIREEGSGR